MKVTDLFCGCGGLSLGFERAGFEVVSAYDNWKVALETYRLNFKHKAAMLDLKDIENSVMTIRLDKPDMIIGGPPCQDFSSAGKRDENNGRGDLTVCYSAIIEKIRPQWFVMENVARIQKTEKLAQAIAVFKDAGYGLTQMVLDASLCNVPQKRKRFILIGSLGKPDHFMDECLAEKLAKRPMTVCDYLGDSLGTEFYYRHPRSYARRGIFSIHEPSPTIRGVNRPIPQSYQIKPNDPVKSIEGVRPLTTVERSYIQTFPETFRFAGSKTETEQMIGNAVPVNLGQYVASAISRYLESEEKRLRGMPMTS